VYHVAWHRFLDHVTGQRNRERLFQRWKTGDVLGIDLDREILIKTLVASLVSDERGVIEKVYLQGCTLEETADELGISVSTVKRLQSRALAWMRSQI